MTISTTTTTNRYTGNAATTVFPYTFRILAATDLVVTKRLATTLVETTLAYPADYSVSGVGNATGGSITLAVAPATGDLLVIERDTSRTQGTSIRNQGSYFPETHETVFDKLTMLAQEDENALARTFTLPKTLDPASYNMNLPVPASGQVLTWSTNGLTNGSVSSGGVVLPGSGRTTTTLTEYLANNYVFNVVDYDADPLGVVNSTAALAAALAAAVAAGGGVLYFPPGTYLGTLSIYNNNISVVGAGANLTTLKQPASASAAKNVIEFGHTELGNAAPQTQKGGVYDITLDGNKGNVPAPASAGDDLVNNGLEFTNHLYGRVRNLRIQNCYNAGINPVIATDYIDVEGVFITNCGSLLTGLSGVDVNSSSYGRYRGIFVQGCGYGVRILDNCHGNDIEVSVRQTNRHGLILDCQASNIATGNRVVAVVHEAATDGVGLGAYVGRNWDGNEIQIVSAYAGCNFSANVVTPVAAVPAIQIGSETFSDADKPQGNKIRCVAYKSAGPGVLLRANYNEIEVDAMENSQLSALGQYAIDIGGSWNSVKVHCRDSAVKQRGVAIRAAGGETGTAATENLITIEMANPTSPCDDTGTRTKVFRNRRGVKAVAATTGDTPVASAIDPELVRYTANLTGNSSCTISTTAIKGDRFRIVRSSATGAFTLTVQDSTPTTIKVIPNSTAAFVEAEYDGTVWALTGYGTL